MNIATLQDAQNNAARTLSAADFRIYVAVLADYNNGRLHGAWIDCDGKDADDLQDEVNALLRSSLYPNVTVMCPDCEGHTYIINASTGSAETCTTCRGRGAIRSAEEYAIHDHEGFGELVSEYTSLAGVAEIVDILESCDDAAALLAFCNDVACGSLADAADNFEDAYQGCYGTEQEFAVQLLDSLGEVDDDSLASRYFDYDAFTRDLFMTDYTMTDGGYVFRRDY